MWLNSSMGILRVMFWVGVGLGLKGLVKKAAMGLAGLNFMMREQ